MWSHTKAESNLKMSEEQTSFLVLFHAFETVFTPSIIFVNFRAFEFPPERCLAIAYVYDQSFMQRAHELRFVQEADQRLFFSFPQSSLWLFSLMSFLSFFGFYFAFLFWFFFYNYSLYLVQLSLLRLHYNKIYDKLTKRDFNWREYRCKTH